MITSEQLNLMINSVVDDFNNQYPEALDIYFKTITSSLNNFDYEKIYFCFCKIYDFYDLDNKCKESFKIFLDTKIQLEDYLKRSKIIENEKNNLYKFWVSFTEWYKLQKKSLSSIFLDKYRMGHYEEDYYERQCWVIDSIICNEDRTYKIEYGEKFIEPNNENIDITIIRNYIEMIYKEYLKEGKGGKYPFAVQVNNTFAKFGLPYKIKNGKIKNEAYKTTCEINSILSYEQFERKITFAEQMILHNDLMDKHTALEYIADSFCYFTSLFQGNKDAKSKAIAKIISNNEESNIYKDTLNEINDVYDIVNGNYDIRHNEYYNSKTNQLREPLNECFYIEYLYNRIYALLYILRLKYKQGDLK